MVETYTCPHGFLWVFSRSSCSSGSASTLGRTVWSHGGLSRWDDPSNGMTKGEGDRSGGNHHISAPGPSFRGAKWMGVGVPFFATPKRDFSHHPLEGPGILSWYFFYLHTVWTSDLMILFFFLTVDFLDNKKHYIIVLPILENFFKHLAIFSSNVSN